MEIWLRDNEHTIKIIATVVATIFALMQYFGHLKEVRVEKTLEFYEHFSSDPIFASRTNVLKSWESLWPKIKQLRTPSTPQETKALREQWKNIVVSTVTSETQLSMHTNIMFDFFDALQVCIENNICDEKSAHDLLQTSAREFFENNCAYVAYMRFNRNNKNFGIKTETLVNSTCNVEIFKD